MVDPTLFDTSSSIAVTGKNPFDPYPLVGGTDLDAMSIQTAQQSLQLSSDFDSDAIAQSAMAFSNQKQSSETQTASIASDSLVGLAVAQPDLVISNLSAPTKIAAGSSINLNYTIKNQGQAAITIFPGLTNKFYLSKDTTLSSDDIYAGSDFVVSNLAAGSSIAESSYVSFGNNLNTGTYYLFCYADANGNIAESSENNNSIYQAIEIVKPDLVITNTNAPAKIAAGSTINLSYNLKNQGQAAAYTSLSFKNGFYLSQDTTLDSNDSYLTSDYFYGTVAAGTSITKSFYISLNSNLQVGTYYLFSYADADGKIAESNENNNAFYQAIEIVKPDLAIANFSAPLKAGADAPINITYTLANKGQVTTSNSALYPLKMDFYLSKDGTFSSNDIFLDQEYIWDKIPANSSQARQTTITLSNNLTPGTYYLFAYADGENSISETNENNNLVSQKIEIVPFSYASGYGLVNAAAAVAKALGQNPFANVANLGGENWGADLVKAPEVWAKGYTGKGVVVAVLDTGVDRNHADLSSNIWKNGKEIAGNNKDDDGNGYIDDVYGWNFTNNSNNTLDVQGHGTHVSGTIAGVKNNFGVTGIAYNAKIMPVKVLGDNGSGSNTGIAQGIRYAVDNGANVINLSLGGSTGHPDYEAAIQYASSKGVIVVMASGNDGGSQPIYPANYAKKWGLAVGAVDRNKQLANFSNYAGSDPLAYVTAPGVDVYSTIPNDGYDYKNGTSMATPHVSGVVALMLSAKKGLTDAQVRQYITQTAGNVLGSA